MSPAVPTSRPSSGVPLFQPGAIDNYFQGHSSFGYNPSPEASVLRTFKRLAISQGWDEERRKKEKAKFQTAVDVEFTARVGSGFALSDWQRLAKVIGIEPLPVTITQCRKMIKKENINIYHILHAYRRATEVKNIEDVEACKDIRRFKNVAELRKYTLNHGMFYKKEFAKGSVLKGLLKRLR
ncbi:uncharacterized protein DFL_000679 [Arthrobotrys flagrans]|uniref:Uncharacterized protein n=1 Tax=Arthrobotrys flagrans TaxID=97331 RepID=A0A437AEK6_ARTFL|nr:hypothetical protein DFL_000679 [Arthrobotrys flagrans]